MKRARPDGSCAHINIEFTPADYANILLRHGRLNGAAPGSQASPSASHACCACGQSVSHGCGSAAEGDTAGGSLLRGCPCGSTLLIDVVRSELYCCSCRDYVYHPAFDEGRQLSHIARRYVDRGLSPGLPQHDPGLGVRAKRARAAREAPAPLKRDEAEEFQDEDAVTPAARVAVGSSDVAPDGFPAGLRGLNNLGNTCFMNSVLQVFIHSPLMRNYFLGQGHSQSACAKDSKSPGTPCLSCELDAVFAAAYSGDRAPLSPTDFLYSWWTFADSLAGYRQQDAHEFYLSALSGLSSAMIAESVHTRPPQAANPGPASRAAGAASPVKEEAAADSPLRPAAGLACSGKDPQLGAALGSPGSDLRAGESGATGHACEGRSVSGVGGPTCEAVDATAGGSAEPAAAAAAAAETGGCSGGRRPLSLSLVDAVFGGILRSDVTCSVCGHTSTAYDPFLDISLDMVAVGPGLPQLPFAPAGRPLQSETSPPASSPTPTPTPLHKPAAAEDDETEADGASRGAAAAVARPSASTCGGGGGGRSSLSALSLPSPSPSLSMDTGTGVCDDEAGEGEVEVSAGEEAQRGGGERGRRQPGAAASPSTGSGSVPHGGTQPRGGAGAAAAGAGAGTVAAGSGLKLQGNGASTASDDSCDTLRGGGGGGGSEGPPAAAGAAAAGALRSAPPAARNAASGAPQSRVRAPVASGRAAAAAAGAPRTHSGVPGAGAGAVGSVSPREAGTGPAGTTSDSVAAAESAADGGGAQAEVEAEVEVGAAASPDDCITSSSPAVGMLAPAANTSQLPPAGAEHGAAQDGTSTRDAGAGGAAATAGAWHGDPGGRGLTPGVSASCAEDATEGGPPERDEDMEPPSTQPSPSPMDGQPPPGSWATGRGGAGGRAPRGRGRGGGRGRGRGRGAAGGRGAGAGGAAKRGVGGGGTVPQMGQPGASAGQMLDPRLSRRLGTADGEAIQAGGSGSAGHATLHGCLRHFVTPERLSAGEAWVCSACQRRQPATKQLSIRRLPPVLALHVKRFEQRHHHHHHHQAQQQQHDHQSQSQQQAELGPAQGSLAAAAGHAGAGGQAQGGGTSAAAAPARPGRHAARKVQTQLQFPVALDLAPYTTPAILRDRYHMRDGPSGEEATAAGHAHVHVKLEPGGGGGGGAGDAAAAGSCISGPSCRYQLFAVISHKGDLSGGHYVVFVRPGGGLGGAAGCGGWYQCDDAWVTAVSEADVTSCQAYMLFYSAEF